MDWRGSSTRRSTEKRLHVCLVRSSFGRAGEPVLSPCGQAVWVCVSCLKRALCAKHANPPRSILLLFIWYAMRSVHVASIKDQSGYLTDQLRDMRSERQKLWKKYSYCSETGRFLLPPPPLFWRYTTPPCRREREGEGKGEREMRSEALAGTEKSPDAPAGIRIWCPQPRLLTVPGSILGWDIWWFFCFCQSFTSYFPFSFPSPFDLALKIVRIRI